MQRDIGAVAYISEEGIEKGNRRITAGLETRSFSASAYRNLVLYLAHNNSDEEAIAVFRKAQQRRISSPELHWGLGLAYLGQSKITQARDEFQRIGRAGRDRSS